MSSNVISKDEARAMTRKMCEEHWNHTPKNNSAIYLEIMMVINITI